MENQEKKLNSLEYFDDKVTDLQLYNSEYKMIENAFKEAKKMYEEEIENAYKKGYLEGAKDYLKPFKNQIWENLKHNYLLEQFNKNK